MIDSLTWWFTKRTDMRDPGLPLFHVLEAELTDIKSGIQLTVLLWVRTIVPSVDLILPKVDFLNVPYLGLLLMLEFEFFNLRVIVFEFLISWV